MKIRARTIVLSLLALLLIVVIGGITAIGWQVVLGPKARPVNDRKFASSPERLARGQYLVEGPAACFHCHSPANLHDPTYPIIEGKKGAGWEMPIPELGSVHSRNITSDKETGLGNWTDDEIARAIQEGISKDGTALFPIMPYMNFRHLTDEDLASVIVYLRTIPAVSNAEPRTKLIFPLSLIVKTIPLPLTSPEPQPARTTPESRGEYLVRYVAGCGDCHTPADDKGRPIPGMEFGGGGPFHDIGNGNKDVFSANITQDPSGIPHYDEALFMQTLRTGQLPGRMLSHIMPFSMFKNITDDDLRDIFAYLKTLPPVKHRINNTDPPTDCPLCKQKHGQGNLNKAAQ